MWAYQIIVFVGFLVFEAQIVPGQIEAKYYCTSQPPANVMTDALSGTPVQVREETVIPVVVHILYSNDFENISRERIYSQIDVLNEDYNRQNRDIVNVPDLFEPFTGNPDFRFCIAQMGPDGSVQEGIVRKQTDIRNIGEAESTDGLPIIKYSILGGSDAWDPTRYLNIWLGERNTTLGESTFPGHPIPEEEGVVIDPGYFGRRNNPNPPFHLGRVATHEIGHFFGLLHPWGNETGCGTDDDMIADTPEQEGSYFGCPSFPQISCNSADMYMNFMNFCDDDCLHFFTGDQSRFMQNVLQTHRQGLINHFVCAPPPDSSSIEDRIRISYLHTHIELEFEPADPESYHISLFNLQGQLIHTEQVENRIYHHINTIHLPFGVYIIQIQSGNDYLLKKFFKGS